MGKQFLIVVNAYSKYPEVVPVPRITSRQTVTTIRKLCAQHGVPETIVSDNGPQFTSQEFKDFCIAITVSHILSPPYHAQSNGRAKRFVDTFKRGLLKLRGEGDMEKNLDTFLLTYRTTPCPTLPSQQSPAKMFLGRKPRTTLDLLLPTKQPSGHNESMERQFNRRHGAVPRKFEVADPVQVHYRHSDDWKAASVRKRIRGRLYEVTMTDGLTRRFHANQMRPRHTLQSADQFKDFLSGFNLPVPCTQVTRGEPEPAAIQTTDLIPGTYNQEAPRLDDKGELPSKVSVGPRKSKHGHIPKKQFELRPRQEEVPVSLASRGSSCVLPGVYNLIGEVLATLTLP
jgi:hypothetical protein